MKKFNYLLTAMIIVFALFGCKTSEEAIDPKDTVSEAPTSSTELATEETPAASEDSQEERTLFASIKKTPCFGRCPTYSMKIYSDGFVEYEGTRDVDMIGKYTTTISQEKMDEILATAKEINFFSFEDKYDDGMITDLPSATTTIVSEDETKSVMRRHGYPKRILTLEQLFDDLMTSEQWTSEDGEIYPPER